LNNIYITTFNVKESEERNGRSLNMLWENEMKWKEIPDKSGKEVRVINCIRIDVFTIEISTGMV
jgi:hypothetical protein